MKRIFLTSAVALCVACPAFAATDLGTSGTADCTDTYLGVAEGSTTFEAKWNADQFTISFAKGTAGTHDASYVTGSTASVSPVTFDDTNIALTANGFAARGYRFVNWSSENNLETGAATATTYNDGARLATYAYDNNPTLTAVWAPKTYNVVYAAGTNGSGSSTDTNGATFDASYTIKGMGASASGVTPNAGYHFVRWNGTSTDTAYTPATYSETQTLSPYTIDGALTLTAEFAADAHKIIYKGGMAGARPVTATAMANQNVEFDQANVALAANTYAIDGYTFAGWKGDFNKDGTAAGTAAAPTADYINQDTISVYKVLGDLTLTAQWTANDYTITYNCGAPKTGSASTPVGPTTATTAVKMDGSYTLAAANNCTLPGYTFAGWSCPNLPGTAGANGFAAGATGTYSYAGNVTCTAQWTQNTIGLTWYNDSAANNGTAIEGATPSCTYDETITLPTAPTKKGYHFEGWKLRSNNSNNSNN